MGYIGVGISLLEVRRSRLFFWFLLLLFENSGRIVVIKFRLIRRQNVGTFFSLGVIARNAGSRHFRRVISAVGIYLRNIPNKVSLLILELRIHIRLILSLFLDLIIDIQQLRARLACNLTLPHKFINTLGFSSLILFSHFFRELSRLFY